MWKNSREKSLALSEQMQTTAFPRPLFSWQYFLVAFLALSAIIVSLSCARSRLLMPFEIDFEEGNVLNAGLRIAHGQTPYPTPGSFPYVLNPYGPIGYVATAAGIKTFGVRLFGPRFFILAAGLGVVCLIGALTKRLGGRWDASVLVALSYLCLPLVSYWLPLLRVDFLAVFLSLLGLYTFARFSSAWPVAGLIFAFAILTKQTAVAAPAAVFLELVAQRKTGRAVALLGIVGATVLACMLALGKEFVFAFLKTHPDPYSFRHAFSLSFAALHGCMLILVIVAYAVVFGWRSAPQSRLAWFYICMCSITALSAGKLGSNMNHFLEWTAAVCILCGLALSELLQRNDALARPFGFALVVLSAVFATMSQRNFGSVGAGQKGCADAYAFVRTSSAKRIMSDDISLLVLGRKPVLVSNPFVITQLGDSVNWQAGTIQHLVQQQYFDLIVLGGTVQSFMPQSGGWSPDVMSAIGSHYVPFKYFQCEYAKVAYAPDSSRSSKSVIAK